MVVWGGTNAAARENHIPGVKSPLQCCSDAVWNVTDIVGIGQLQAPRTQEFNHLRQVLVSPFTREDFIANDDDAERHSNDRIGV